MAGVGVLKRWEKGDLGGGITQEGLIFRNRKSAKGRKARKKLREPVMQGKWSRRFEPMPCPPQREIFAEHC